MKKIVIIMAITMLSGLTACGISGISQEEYDSVASELNSLKNETVSEDNISKEEYDNVVNQLNALKNDNNNSNKKFRPHINELPSCKAVASGWKTNFNDVFKFMSEWIPGDKASLLYPNDFLCFSNEKPESWMWLKLLDDENIDTKGFEMVEFPGGLYVSAITIDDNQTDMTKTIDELKNWVNEQENFELDFTSGRYQMTRRITSDETWEILQEALGYEQLEIFIPIKIK